MILSRENLKYVAEILEAMYGRPEGSGSSPEDRVILDEIGKDPVDILVATVLSQATSDKNSSLAFRSLKDRFRRWEDLISAPSGEVEEAIKCGGLAVQKAAYLKEILGAIAAREGRVSLDFLRAWQNAEAFGYLVSLKGVGPKTAACVLLFGLGKSAFPVDTHVLRVLRRLGMAGEKESARRVQDALEANVPTGLEYELHVNLIRHGRKTCLARRPRCERCLLLDVCTAEKKKWPH